VRQNIQNAQGYFFINFNKVKADALGRLRNNLSDCNTKVFVTKNSLFKIAIADKIKGSSSELLCGETAIVFIYDKDIVKACKTLVDFSKENEVLQLKGGFLGEQPLTSEELITLAKLPPKEMLMGMVVNGFAAPVTGFLCVLNQVILKFVWVIEEIKKQRTEGRGQKTEDRNPTSDI
jgi:large subunit ribosomal protein L10